MKKIIISVLLLLGLFLIFPGGELLAEEVIQDIDVSNVDSLTVSWLEEGQAYCLGQGSERLELIKLVSSNENIATVDFYDDFCNSFLIFAKGAGSCSVTITDENNCQKTIKVIVTPEYFKKILKLDTSIGGLSYGSRRINVETVPNCTGVLKIRKDKYKFTVGKSGEKTIKLKRVYKLNEKVTLTLKKNGVKYTRKYKFFSSTNSVKISGSKKKLKLTVFNVHKGDTIKLKHRGKTYSKKITKNYGAKDKSFSFKTKKKVRKNGEVIKVTIYNKSKQKLDSITFTLQDGYATTEIEDEDEYNQ